MKNLVLLVMLSVFTVNLSAYEWSVSPSLRVRGRKEIELEGDSIAYRSTETRFRFRLDGKVMVDSSLWLQFRLEAERSAGDVKIQDDFALFVEQASFHWRFRSFEVAMGRIGRYGRNSGDDPCINLFLSPLKPYPFVFRDKYHSALPGAMFVHSGDFDIRVEGFVFDDVYGVIVKPLFPLGSVAVRPMVLLTEDLRDYVIGMEFEGEISNDWNFYGGGGFGGVHDSETYLVQAEVVGNLCVGKLVCVGSVGYNSGFAELKLKIPVAPHLFVTPRGRVFYSNDSYLLRGELELEVK